MDLKLLNHILGRLSEFKFDKEDAKEVIIRSVGAAAEGFGRGMASELKGDR